MAATKYVYRRPPRPANKPRHSENAAYMHPSSGGSRTAASVPTEIWSTIFHLLLEDDWPMSDTPRSATKSFFVTLLNITHVHKYWRTILLMDPQFWSTVFIFGPPFSTAHNEVDFLEEWITRSKTLPLTLKIVEKQSWADVIADEGQGGSSGIHAAICNFVKKHNSRWRRLDIFFSPMVSPNNRLKILALGDFPALECLSLCTSDRVEQSGHSLPRVSITAPKIRHIEIVGRVTLVSSQPTNGPQNASHPTYLKARKITIREQPITYFIKCFSSISLENFSNTTDEQAGTGVEEIHYTNKSELPVYAAFNHDPIILNRLTSFTSQIASPSNCAWLLDHLDCPSLTTLDLTTGRDPGTAPPLANISQLMTRNRLRLQVLRLSAVGMHERELLEMLEGIGDDLRVLRLVNRSSGQVQHADEPSISNETLRKLTLPDNFSTNKQSGYREGILCDLTEFSYVGPTKDLKLTCVLKMIESRTMMHRFILETKSKLVTEEVDKDLSCQHHAGKKASRLSLQTGSDGGAVIRFPGGR